MCNPLGKNLLLPSWFTEDFEEESSASSLGIFLGVQDSLGKNLLLPYWGYFGEEFSASSLGKNLLLPYWRYFREESSASSLGIAFNVLWSIVEESSAFSMGMMLDTLELLRKSLLFPLWGCCLIGLIHMGQNLLLPY